MALPQPKKPQIRNKKTSSTPTSLGQQTSVVSKKQYTDSSRSVYHKKNTGGSRLIFAILLVLALCWWMYRDSLSRFFLDPKIDTGKNITGEYTLFVGKDVILTGTLERNPSTRYSYTHFMDEVNYGKVGLRSSTINLYELKDEVSLQGKVVDFVNNMYIIEIGKVIPQQATWSQILYFPTPGILIEDIVKDWFTVTQNNTTKTIAIINPTTNAFINIRYFVCTPEKTYDCSLFEKSFKTATGAQSVDEYENTFYKLNDENTWFANLDDRYGIYIETSNAQLFPLIIEKTQFITDEWAEKHLSTTAKTLCKQNDVRLQNITSGSLSQMNTGFIWNIDGTDTNLNIVQCKLSFNPENLETITSIWVMKDQWSGTVNVPTTITWDTTTWNIVTWNTTAPKDKEPTIPSTSLPSPSGNQFPLRPGKELLFSTRGMTLSFPSPNISFVSTNISEWPQGLKCNAQTNIVEYSKKDKVSTNPSVSLYFCTGNIPSALSSSYRIIVSGTTTILVQVNDASWVDFANAITVQ